MDILISNHQKKRINKGRINRHVKGILNAVSCPENAEISILLTDDDFIKGLNKKYLKKDRPTDVLSFPMSSGNRTLKRISHLTSHISQFLLGDIVISVDTAERQAVLQRTSIDEEIKRLLVHGILHLFGFEHERGGKKAQEMRREENLLMDLLKN